MHFKYFKITHIFVLKGLKSFNLHIETLSYHLFQFTSFLLNLTHSLIGTKILLYKIFNSIL